MDSPNEYVLRFLQAKFKMSDDELEIPTRSELFWPLAMVACSNLIAWAVAGAAVGAALGGLVGMGGSSSGGQGGVIVLLVFLLTLNAAGMIAVSFASGHQRPFWRAGGAFVVYLLAIPSSMMLLLGIDDVLSLAGPITAVALMLTVVLPPASARHHLVRVSAGVFPGALAVAVGNIAGAFPEHWYLVLACGLLAGLLLLLFLETSPALVRRLNCG